MRTRFSIAVLLAALVLGSMLIGCSRGQTTETTPTGSPAGIGQKVSTGGWDLTVSNVRALNAVEGKKAAQGKVLLALDLLLANTGGKSATVGTSAFKLNDEAGPVYKAVKTKTKGWIDDLEAVAAGKTAKSVAVFEVPIGTSGLVLSFQPEGAEAKQIKVR